MTDEEMRVAIAEECGWKLLPSGFWLSPKATKEHPNGELFDNPPNWLIDLNASHEMEEVGIEPYFICEYSSNLRRIVDGEWKRQGKRTFEFSDLDWQYAIAHATARQRAEAFLAVVKRKAD